MCPKDFFREGTAPKHLMGDVRSRSQRPDFIRQSLPDEEPELSEGSTTTTLPEPDSSSAPLSDESSGIPGSGMTTSEASEGSRSVGPGSTKAELSDYLREHLDMTEDEMSKMTKKDMLDLVKADQDG